MDIFTRIILLNCTQKVQETIMLRIATTRIRMVG